MPDSARFAYTTLTNALGEAISRPVLEVELTYLGQSIRVSGLVDSGADVNVLPHGVGTALGLVWDEQRYGLQLSGNLANLEARAVVLSARIADLAAIDLAIAWTQTDQAPLILGQTNFFETVDVGFYRSDAYFSITSKFLS